jgi:hypothetical protein
MKNIKPKIIKVKNIKSVYQKEDGEAGIIPTKFLASHQRFAHSFILLCMGIFTSLP